MHQTIPVPSLVVLVGPSSSGKSTWATENFAVTEIVSSDELRARLGADETDRSAGTPAFEILDRIVAERMSRKLTTVIDTTGLDRDRRLAWVALARDASVPAFAVVFDADLETCLERNEKRPRKRPRTVIRRQHGRLAGEVAAIGGEGFTAVLTEAAVRPVSPVVFAEPSAPGDPAPAHTFGLILSRFDWEGLPFAETLATVAARAEEAGFRDLWVMDHFRQIRSVGREWEDIPEAYAALAFAAARTKTIRLGALVTAVTHRHPALLAKTIATLDVLSTGRANCGLGLAWDADEHRGYGIDFPGVADRYELLEETIELLRLMWGKGSPEYHGRRIHADRLACYPRPVQARVPILVGGSGETKTLRLVARLADGANVFGDPERVAHKVSILERHCEAVDRDPSEIEVTHLVNALTAPDRSSLRELVETIRPSGVSFDAFLGRNNGAVSDDLVALFAAYHRAGASHSIVAVPGAHHPGTIEAFAPVIEAMR